MSLHRKCEIQKQGYYLQRGRGVGGVLSSLYNKLLPIATNVGEKLLTSPEAKSTLDTVASSALDAGINIVLDKVKNRNKGTSLKTNLTQAKTEIESAVKSNVRKAVKRAVCSATAAANVKKSRSKLTEDIFDDYSLDVDDD